MVYECDCNVCYNDFSSDDMCPACVDIDVYSREDSSLCLRCPKCCTLRIDTCILCGWQDHLLGPVEVNAQQYKCAWCQMARRRKVKKGRYWTPQEHHLVLPHVHTQVMTWMLISNRLEKNVIPMGVSTLISSYVATNIEDGPRRKKIKTQ